MSFTIFGEGLPPIIRVHMRKIICRKWNWVTIKHIKMRSPILFLGHPTHVSEGIKYL